MHSLHDIATYVTDPLGKVLKSLEAFYRGKELDEAFKECESRRSNEILIFQSTEQN